MGKIDIRLLFQKYFETLCNYQTNERSHFDIFLQLVFPVVVSIGLFFIWPNSCSNAGDLISNFISCISIISGFMCGVAVLLFQLRLQMCSQQDPKPLDRELALVDESFHISMWAVFDGLIVVGFLCAAPLLNNVNELVSRFFFCLAISFLINFLQVTCMVLKRISAAYTSFSRGWKM